MGMSPIKKEKLEMAKIRWIHISDIHIGYNADTSEALRKGLPEHLKKLARQNKFDYLFITGDLKFWGKNPCKNSIPGESFNPDTYFIETAQFIDSISSSGILTDKKNIFIVPGNHDIARAGIKETAKKIFDPESTALKKTAKKILSKKKG